MRGEREELARVIYDAILWDEYESTRELWAQAADAVLAHLRAKGWGPLDMEEVP